jgi:hypothetical protein
LAYCEPFMTSLYTYSQTHRFFKGVFMCDLNPTIHTQKRMRFAGALVKIPMSAAGRIL